MSLGEVAQDKKMSSLRLIKHSSPGKREGDPRFSILSYMMEIPLLHFILADEQISCSYFSKGSSYFSLSTPNLIQLIADSLYGLDHPQGDVSFLQ